MTHFALAVLALAVLAVGGVALFEEGRAAGRGEAVRIPCSQHSPPRVQLRVDCEEAARTCRARGRLEKIRPQEAKQP